MKKFIILIGSVRKLRSTVYTKIQIVYSEFEKIIYERVGINMK